MQDCKTVEELIAKIDESAVQKSVKKKLGADLRAFKVLADRLKVSPLTELSDYAGQLCERGKALGRLRKTGTAEHTEARREGIASP